MNGCIKYLREYCYECGQLVSEQDAVGFKLRVGKPQQLLCRVCSNKLQSLDYSRRTIWNWHR